MLETPSAYLANNPHSMLSILLLEMSALIMSSSRKGLTLIWLLVLGMNNDIVEAKNEGIILFVHTTVADTTSIVFLLEPQNVQQ